MNTLPLPAIAVLAGGLLLGIVGNALLRAPGAPGLNLFVWAVAVAGATALLHHRGKGRLGAEAATWLGIGVLFAAGLMWRDAPALKLLSLMCVIVAFALPAFRAGSAWIRKGGIGEYIAALAAAAAHAVFGAALTVVDVDWDELRNASGIRGQWRHAAAVGRGLVIATPFIIVFGGLFIAADAVFAEIVSDVVRIDLNTLTSHVLLIGFLSWVAAGYLRGFLVGTRPALLDDRASPRPVLGITETGVALALLDVLFLAFVIVQFRYLFGGSELVEVTPGLTYAEYARRGFFELIAVAALMLPVLLLADWLLRREGARDERIFRVLTGIQIVLLFAVMASAMQRMRLYQSAYGMTEQRFYATALLILLAAVVLWFSATVLRGRRGSFGFGTLAASLATILVLLAANPDAIIARTNIARVYSGADDGAAFDASYVSSLSADAVPVLVSALPGLPQHVRCPIAQRLLERWPPDTRADVRSWSWSSARARNVIRANEGLLRELAGRVSASGRDATVRCGETGT